MFHSDCPVRVRRAGFTLVELLVVITIIGILIGLLMPGINGAREAARNITCLNNLHQIGLAAGQHLEKWKILPTGGWGYSWVGDPDRGFDRKQPGGWTYNVLPFLDMVNLHDLGKGLTGEAKKDKIGQAVRTPLQAFNCPTRRRCITYPGNAAGTVNGNVPLNGTTLVGRSDYAANSGSQSWNEYFGGPGSLEEGDNPNYGSWLHSEYCNGVSYERSEVSDAMVIDGMQQTIFAGEKYINPDAYATGSDPGDNESIYTGFNNDNFRVTNVDRPPRRDRPGLTEQFCFGSAHSGRCNFVFCDGSARGLSYGVDTLIYSYLGSRKDQQKVDTSSF